MRAGLDVRGRRVDVIDHAALDAAIDEAAAMYGRLDVVFANVGVDPGPGFVGAWAGSTRPRNEEGALERYTTERWKRAIDINLTGIFATMRAGRGTCARSARAGSSSQRRSRRPRTRR